MGDEDKYQPSRGERTVSFTVVVLLVAFVAYLVVRNEPFADPNLVVFVRVLLSLAVAALGATLPGFLHVGWSAGGLVIRAGGALALFVLTFVLTPDVLTPTTEPDSTPGSETIDTTSTGALDRLGDPAVEENALAIMDRVGDLRPLFAEQPPGDLPGQLSQVAISQAVSLAELAPAAAARSLVTLVHDREDVVALGALVALTEIAEAGLLEGDSIAAYLKREDPFLDVSDISVSGVDFSVLGGSEVFKGSIWRDVYFSWVTMDSLNLSWVRMSDVQFNNSTFNGTVFCESQLRGVSFVRVRGELTDFRVSILSGISGYSSRFVEPLLGGVRLSISRYSGDGEIFHAPSGQYTLLSTEYGPDLGDGVGFETTESTVVGPSQYPDVPPCELIPDSDRG